MSVKGNGKCLSCGAGTIWRNGASDVPASDVPWVLAARLAIVGVANSALGRSSIERARRTLAIICMASSELPAELEEVLIDAHALEPEYLRPDAGQDLFSGRAGRNIGRASRGQMLRSWQRFRVRFAMFGVSGNESSRI